MLEIPGIFKDRKALEALDYYYYISQFQTILAIFMDQ